MSAGENDAPRSSLFSTGAQPWPSTALVGQADTRELSARFANPVSNLAGNMSPRRPRRGSGAAITPVAPLPVRINQRVSQHDA
jgi:hypothetical protein